MPRKPATPKSAPAVELVGAIVAHVPTLNVGVIAELPADGFARVEWNSAEAPETVSTVPLAELVLNPDGVTTNADVAELVKSVPTIAVPGSPLVMVPAPELTAEPTDDGGAKVTPKRRRRARPDAPADGTAETVIETSDGGTATITVDATDVAAAAAAAADELLTPADGEGVVLGGRAVRAAAAAPKMTKALRLAAIGETPGNKRDRARFDAYPAAAQRRIRNAAAALYGTDESRTVARCWIEALDAAPAPPPPPEPVECEFLLDDRGLFRVHRAGCPDVAREIAKRSEYPEPGRATYASQLDAVRDLWDDQIRESWDGDGDYADAPPEWLAAHGYVTSVIFVPCVRRSLAAFPGVDQSRHVRDTNRGREVPGYVLIKARNEFDQFRAIDPDADGQWLTRCNAHGTTSVWPSRNASRWHGWAARRVEWCGPCKTDADKTDADKSAAASDATAEHDAAAKS